MKPDIQIFVPRGAFGGSKSDSLLEETLRLIAKHHEQPGQWADKYGTQVDNEIFMMHPYCWCEREDCPWCRDEDEHGKAAPNFHHKKTGLRVWWYKYIGRGMEVSRKVSARQVAQILLECTAMKPAQPAPPTGGARKQ